MRSTIAHCCLNAAAMLDLADSGERRDINSLQRCQKANRGQAELLRNAANLADELWAALQDILVESDADHLLASVAVERLEAALATGREVAMKVTPQKDDRTVTTEYP